MKIKLGIIFCIFYCTTETAMKTVLRIGHRGCAYAFENSKEAFDRALTLSVDAIEFDVRKCASGELVVFHDERIDRLTKRTGFVDEHTLTELKIIKLKDGQEILTLTELLDYIDKRAVANIELKGPGTALPVADIVIHYVEKKGWRYKDFLITSFDHHQLKQFERAAPGFRTGALICGIPLTYAQFTKGLRAEYVLVEEGFVSQKFVDDVHGRGKKILVYTVNHPAIINRIKMLNVDGIISDYPDRL